MSCENTFDEKRGEHMGWYSSATMVGRFLAPFIGGALIFGDNFHWVYIATGVIGTLALLAAIRLPLSKVTSDSVGGALKRERSEIWSDIRIVLTHRGILVTSAIEAVQYFAFGCLEVFLPIFLDEQAGFSTIEIGSLFTIQIVVATLTKPIMGRFSDKYSRVPVIIAGLLAGGITMAFMTYSYNYLLLAVLTGFFGLGLATVTASTSALVADLSKSSSHGGALGVLSSVMDIGHSTGPMVGGLLISALNYKAAFGIFGGIMAIASLAFGLIMRQIPKSNNSPD
jgi:DHA1 family multidrug resistance protein-like MFS transporter